MKGGKIKDQTKRSSGMGIRSKLLLWLLLIALLPIIAISFIEYKLSERLLYQLTFARIESTLSLQQKALKNYFAEREKNLKSIADEVDAVQKRAYGELETIKKLRYKSLNDYFQKRFEDIDFFSEKRQQQNLNAYILNPNANSKYNSFLKDWLIDKAFLSLLIVNPKGKIIFSSDKQIKQGTIIKKDTSEWLAFEKGKLKTSFADFDLSLLYEKEPAAYFSTPIKTTGARNSVFLLRLKNDAFDGILNEVTGLGKTGETYIVGSDGMFRSNSRFSKEPTLLNQNFLVDTESVAEALSATTGERVVVNIRGEYVLSSYTSLEIQDITWALIVEINQTEAVAPKLDIEKGYLKRVSENYGFPDLYLIGPDGNIFYSTGRRSDYKTNIITGPFSDSGLAKTVASVFKTNTGVISDYSLYRPAGNIPAAFMAQPLVDNDEVTLIAAIQIPLDQIGDIMKDHGQFSREHAGNDAYLIGQDNMWRTESLHSSKYNVESTLLNPEAAIKTKAVNEALNGKKGTEVIVNGSGETVLSSWAPFIFKSLKWAIVNEVNRDEIELPIRNLLKTVALITGFALLAVILFSMLISGGITGQVKAIMKVMNKVKAGDYKDRVIVTGKDELGEMASFFNSMIETTSNLMDSRKNEHDQLQDSIVNLLGEITQLAEGDLTVRATIREDIIGTIADSLNLIFEKLIETISKVKDSSDQVGVTANRLIFSTDNLSKKSDTQSVLVNRTVTEINQITSAMELVAQNANKSAETSDLSKTAAIEGTKAVEDTSKSLVAVRGNVQKTAKSIKRLGERSQEISDFIKTIDDIADRTYILSLNASIQASAAGESGHGFAVVALEIQRLATKVAASTKQIETLINNILNEIIDAGISMDACIQEVSHSTILSADALAKLQDINKRSTEVAKLINDVSFATTKQAKTLIQVAKTVDDVGIISKETALETRKTSSSMQNMAMVADEMLQSVGVFKLSPEKNEEDKSIELETIVESEMIDIEP